MLRRGGMKTAAQFIQKYVKKLELKWYFAAIFDQISLYHRWHRSNLCNTKLLLCCRVSELYRTISAAVTITIVECASHTRLKLSIFQILRGHTVAFVKNSSYGPKIIFLLKNEKILEVQLCEISVKASL